MNRRDIYLLMLGTATMVAGICAMITKNETATICSCIYACGAGIVGGLGGADNG